MAYTTKTFTCTHSPARPRSDSSSSLMSLEVRIEHLVRYRIDKQGGDWIHLGLRVRAAPVTSKYTLSVLRAVSSQVNPRLRSSPSFR